MVSMFRPTAQEYPAGVTGSVRDVPSLMKQICILPPALSQFYLCQQFCGDSGDICFLPDSKIIA